MSKSPFGPAADQPPPPLPPGYASVLEDPEDRDRLLAATDLVGRTGGKRLEFGFLHDDVPVEDADWYAHVEYRGTRITEEHKRGPLEAVEALAMRLLNGGQCRCGKVASSDPAGAPGGRKTFLTGEVWTHEQQVGAGVCVWHRDGQRWEPGCDAPPMSVAPEKWWGPT